MKLYFFGDSICFGQFVSPNRIWVNLVTSRLERKYPDLSVQNLSVNGRTTRQALEDMPYQVQAHRPEILYIQFGMNDCNHWVTDNGSTRVSLPGFEANLGEIVLRARLAGAKQIYIATNHPTPHTTLYDNMPGVSMSYQNSNLQFNTVIRKVAVDYQAILVDNEAHWVANHFNTPSALQELVLPDGIHLSESGHRAYADFVGCQLEAWFGSYPSAN